MQKYIGVEIVDAEPTLCQKNDYKSKIGDLGYKVRYKDGYESWCPKEQFEDANRLISGMTSGMTFGMAIEVMKKGYKVTRNGWNGKGQYLELQIPDEHSKMSLPYIYIRTVQNDLVPWLASQTDMLSDDYIVVSSSNNEE